MSNLEISENEMWEQLPHKVGEEKAELLLALSKKVYGRGSGDDALALAESAQEIYESLGSEIYKQDIAHAYTGISHSLKKLNKTEEAIKVIDKAVELLKDEHYPYIDDLYRTKAIWHSELEQWDKTLQCHLDSVRVNEIDGDDEWLAKSQYNVGVAYGHLNDYTSAINQYQIARDIFKKLRAVPEVARCDEAISSAYIELGFGEQALEYGKKALAVARIGNWLVRLMWILANIGQAHMLLENTQDAESAFNEANDLAITVDETDWFFIVQINQEICKLLRITDRDNEAEALEQRVKTIQEIIGKD
jgi:tetratricopeptide (TPR) repeat protein